MAVDPRFCAGAAEVAQNLQKTPGNVEFRVRGIFIESTVAADAMQPLDAVAIVVQNSPLYEPRDKMGRAQFRQQAGVEGDLVDPIADGARRRRDLRALDRIDLH